MLSQKRRVVVSGRGVDYTLVTSLGLVEEDCAVRSRLAVWCVVRGEGLTLFQFKFKPKYQ